MAKRKCGRILHATDLLKGIAGRRRRESDGAAREVGTAERLITVCSLNAEKQAMLDNPEHGPKENQTFIYLHISILYSLLHNINIHYRSVFFLSA